MYDRDAKPAPHLNVVLCLGMGDHIMMPLQLVPDADVIFVIDDGEDDLEELYESIKTTLTEGKRATNLKLASYSHLHPMPIISPSSFHYLSKGKATIEADARYRECDPAIQWNWRLRFRYGGKNRVLMRFNRSFAMEWPAGVTNVKHIILHNKVEVGRLETYEPQGNLKANFLNRTSSEGYRLYGQVTRYWYPNFVIVQAGVNPRGTCVGWIDVKKDYVITNVIIKAIDANDPMVNLLVMETGKVYRVRWRKYNY
jgi:hypothetical protein